MSEGVEILISADDQASKVLAKVSDNVDSKIKHIKEVGRGAKASTEFIGTLANSLGGSVVGSYAAGIAQLSERISNFSEVSKAGAGGALAFKAGLAGVALVAGFKIGTMIGNWAFETERWNKEIEKANASLLVTADRVADMMTVSLSIDTEKISLIADTEEQRREMLSWQTELSKQAEEYARLIKETEAELKAEETITQRIFGISEKQKEMDAAQTAEYRKSLAVVEAEQKAVQNLLRSDVEELRVLKEQAALKKRNDSYIQGLTDEVALLKASKDERFAIEATQKAGKDQSAASRIAALMTEKETIETRKAAIELQQKETEKIQEQRIALVQGKEAAKAFALEKQGLSKEAAVKIAADEASVQKIDDAKKLDELKKKELDNLEQQRIALDRGKEAAHAFALEKQGLDKSTAIKIASEQAAIDKYKEKTPDNQQSVQGRLLTRGTSDDIRKKQLDAALKAYEVLKKLEENTKPWKSKTELHFEVVGR